MTTTIIRAIGAIIDHPVICGKKYNVRVTWGKDDEEVLIGGSELEHDIMKNLDNDDYNKMDDKILYYVDEKKLFTLTDKDLIAHIVHNCPELGETFYID